MKGVRGSAGRHVKALPVHHMVLCALSTDAEELYIQQAVVLIEDAMQVSAVTSLSSLNDGGGGEYPIESFTLVFG